MKKKYVLVNLETHECGDDMMLEPDVAADMNAKLSNRGSPWQWQDADLFITEADIQQPTGER